MSSHNVEYSFERRVWYEDRDDQRYRYNMKVFLAFKVDNISWQNSTFHSTGDMLTMDIAGSDVTYKKNY